MLTGKKILVTSGGTQEYIDDVRVLTNISSGKLGAKIAEKLFWARAEEVHYLHGKNAEEPFPNGPILPLDIPSIIRHQVRTAQDAYNAMRELVPTVDAVIHAMAVSDFTFKRDTPVKCKSNDPEGFIEYMRQTITKNPKIISEIKQWNPKTILIGFKFEVGISWDQLMSYADTSLIANQCDLVVANDKKEMEAAGNHIAHFAFSGAHQAQGYNYKKVVGKEEIAKEIVSFLEAVL